MGRDAFDQAGGEVKLTTLKLTVAAPIPPAAAF
jgi:hypothetical protein